jgi:hypothetical protein
MLTVTSTAVRFASTHGKFSAILKEGGIVLTRKLAVFFGVVSLGLGSLAKANTIVVTGPTVSGPNYTYSTNLSGGAATTIEPAGSSSPDLFIMHGVAGFLGFNNLPGSSANLGTSITYLDSSGQPWNAVAVGTVVTADITVTYAGSTTQTANISPLVGIAFKDLYAAATLPGFYDSFDHFFGAPEILLHQGFLAPNPGSGFAVPVPSTGLGAGALVGLLAFARRKKLA